MNTAVPPGNCVTHGYHGLAACPRCSSSTLPAAPISAGQAHAAVSPFDLIREALRYAEAALDELWRQGRTTRGIYIDSALAALDQLQRDHEALSEGFKRNLRLATEEIRTERDAAVREAEMLRETLTQLRTFTRGYVAGDMWRMDNIIDAALASRGEQSDALDRAYQARDDWRQERDDWRREAETLREAVELALSGLPDPMHPGIPRHAVDGLVAAKIVLMDALGDPDPGNVEAARAALASSRDTTETT